jgi:hypothetical protein
MNLFSRLRKYLTILFSWAILITCPFILKGALLEVRYNLELQFSEPAHTIYGHEQVSIINNAQLPIDTVYFHLSPNALRSTKSPFYQQSENLLDDPVKMSIQSVTSNDSKCEYYNDETLSMAVLLPATLPPGDSVKISIDFTLTIPRGNHIQCPTYSGSTTRLIRFYPMVERLTNKGWTPSKYNNVEPSCSFPFIYNFSIRLPDHYNVISSLAPLSVDSINKKEKLHTFQSSRIKELAVVFSASYSMKSFSVQQISVHLLIPKSNERRYTRPKTKIVHYIIKDILNTYSQLIIDYPYSQLSLTSAKIPTGFTTSNLIILESKKYRNLSFLDYGSIYSLAHAIAKEYFNYFIFEDPENPDWIIGGMASYAASRYMTNNYQKLIKRYHLKNEAYTNYSQIALRLAALTVDREHIGQPLYTSSKKSDAPVLLEQIHHFKGQKVLEMLNYIVGDSVFRECIHDFLTQYKYRPANSHDFFRLVEVKSGKDLNQLYKLWVESKNIPDLKIKRVNKEFRRRDSTYVTRVVVKGAALNALPIEIMAVNANSDTLWTVTKLSTTGLDTVLLYSRYPTRKISLDPHRNIWEFNRLNNHYPYKILFNFLIGIPSIDAYQIFYYPTFDFNKRDVSRIGIKLRGRYWINMRPLFPAQSLDEWTIGLNYGLKSQTVGYDISYSTSLLALFFQPRIQFRSRDYFGLHETTVSSEFYLGEIQYPLLHQIQGYKKISFGAKYLNVRTLEFLNADKWQRGKLFNPFINIVNFHNWGNSRHILRINISAGIPQFETDYEYTKLVVDALVKFRPSKKSWIYERIFFGASNGQMPRQRYFYFFGKNTLENLSFESFRLVKGAGDMRGYGATSPKGKNILTSNTEVRWSFATVDPAIFDLILFFDSGIIPESFAKASLNQFKYDAGIGVEFNALETILIGIHFPFWVSHPVDKKDNFAMRWVLSIDLSL